MSTAQCLRCLAPFEQTTIFHWYCSPYCYNMTPNPDQRAVEEARKTHPEIDGSGYFAEQVFGVKNG